MGKFKDFHECRMLNEQDYSKIIMALAFIEQNSNLNESELSELTEASIMAGITSLFGKMETGIDKVGMKLHKGKGLIDYAKQFAGAGGKLLIAAIKKDKEQVQEIIKGFEKAEFIDFLLKLDMATMHIVTGPIHFVDAVTGWDLAANLKAHTKKAQDTLETIIKTINDLKVKVKTVLDDNVASPIERFLDSIGELLYGKEEDLGEGLNEAVKVKVWMKSYNASAYGLDDLVRLNYDENVVFFDDISVRAGYFTNTEVNFSAPKGKIGFHSFFESNGDYGRKTNAKKELFDYINTKPKLIMKALKKLVQGSSTNLVGNFYVTTADYSSRAYQGVGKKYLFVEKFDISDGKKLIKYLTNYGWDSITYLSVIVYLDGEYTRIESDYNKASRKGLDFKNLSDITNEILLSLNKTEKELDKYEIFLYKNIVQNTIDVTVNYFSLTSSVRVRERRTIPFDITKTKLKTEIKKFLNDIKEYDRQVSGAANSFRSHIQATGGHHGNPVYMD